MGTSLCDITMTLKRQEKIGNIFFLKQDTFSSRKYMFDTFTQKITRDYTAAYSITDLQTFWNESLWIEIKVNRDVYLISLFYSPRTADALFFDSLNKYKEKTLDTTNNIIILGDMNKDVLNPNMHNLKDVLLINTLHNIIEEPPRQPYNTS